MGYVEANLLAGEAVIYKARLHWIIFVKAITLIFLGVVFLLVQPLIAGIIVLIGCGALISPAIDYLTSEFGVTNKRVVIKVGFIRRRTLELLLRHVEAISVDQSVTGRMLDYGSITLTGTGGVKELFANLRAPLEFRRRIQGEASQENVSAADTR
ncbi:MAG: PH domain-containing protein [Deltaproteobacteria bacterium]|nr:PH domain-containing protein [Deltaproteobacteria bacterium]